MDGSTKKIDFGRPGGLPFDQHLLGFMQDGYFGLFKAFLAYLGSLGDGHYIIAGLEEDGSGNLSDGHVAVNGEAMPAKGGPKGASPRIKVVEKKTAVDFETVLAQDVYSEKHAEVAQDAGTPLADFARIARPAELWAQLAEAQKNIQNMEGVLANTHSSTVQHEGITTLVPVDAHAYFDHKTEPGAIKIVLPLDFMTTSLYFEILVTHIGSGDASIIRARKRTYGWNGHRFWEGRFFERSGEHWPVRFGDTGSRPVIYIGELNTSFVHRRVSVIRFQASYTYSGPERWRSGWEVGLERNGFQNITQQYL